jgi:Uma2 family endonuclease
MVHPMHRAERPATYDDIARLPEHQVGELVAGELIVTPRPRSRHAVAVMAIAGQLFREYGEFAAGATDSEGWCVLPEPELHFGADVLVPDLAGWRRGRFTVAADVVGITVVPDWICEVLSPSTARADRVLKMPVYARAGVGTTWIVDPALRTIEVFRLENGRWVVAGLHAGAEPLRAEPCSAVELRPAAWWIE